MEDAYRRIADWLERLAINDPIDPSDSRYVAFEEIEYEDRTLSLRGEDRILPILDCIDLTRKPTCQLFSGYSGNGKSTELRRLRTELRKKGYLVLLADAQEYHDLYHPLSIEDLLVILAGAFGEAVSRELGGASTVPSWWERLVAFLKQDIELRGGKVLGAELKLGLEQGRPFWVEMRDRLAQTPRALRYQAHDYVSDCVAQLRRARGEAGVVFLFDSLERLRGKTEDEFLETMQSVIRVFAQSSSELRLPDCHVVYTVPPYLDAVGSGVSDRYDRPLHLLPSVKIREAPPHRAPFPPGIAGLRELLGKRIPLDAVFGGDESLLDRVILASGGHIRTLLSLHRELLIRAHRKGLPVTRDLVEDILGERSESMNSSIRSRGARVLGKIMDSGRLDRMEDGELPLVARFMDSHHVLCFRNGEGWFDVHPLVRDHVTHLTGGDSLATDG